ncbi:MULTISPECIES: ribosomal-processing cysteine protease Prp [Oceanobacillus]|uniref:Ribosomal processing cysteine protease Prp n=1 Tax=Oceanobacillus kimchii TaxID=746691 RepID=A0ABQ5TM54_9BACI|nr:MULTISPECIES: ribosomal-processing cysteine protease Prp [Oceanobacillus]MBT2598201.1 ribosomal-processing cysteine protease Prp [Oceanobacillus sp. ISL-74]MBT2651120.1 ribosomal-processing cysteine protease Prp [Oceanobacillus sp. ISL-73]MCT1575779.1 ribosomal-processing cysteine protease Prp [Oceanobacillus kimchii]MCT2135416.1 ribosomal-processing cysteine protease Prp [Oceanobacillus kimchii]OEH55526.1 hypothetical protein AQ616_04925 [Oceanobacillus sp. E9]
MIKVTVFQTNNQITAFELSGHADSGPYGYDLVCAGVSAVSFGGVNAVIKLCDTDLHIDQGKDGGYLYVEIPENLDLQVAERVQLLLEGMMVSLQTIEAEYGDHMQVNYK